MFDLWCDLQGGWDVCRSVLVSRRLPHHPMIVLLWEWLRSHPPRMDIHIIYIPYGLSALYFSLVYVSRIFYRCAISWVEARILSRILFDYDVYIPTYQYLLASFFSNPYSLHLTSSSRPFSLLPFRWLLYAFAIRVFQRLYTLHEISYSEYIIQRKEMDEGKTLLVLVCTVTSALGGSSS